MADGRKATWASGGLFVESGDSPQLSSSEAQKHDDMHHCGRHRARHIHDSRNYNPCSQHAGAYLRAAPCLMGRAHGRSPSPESFWEGSSNVFGEFREARSPTTPTSPNEQSLWQRIPLEIPTYPDVPGRREPGTAVYEYVLLCFQAQPLFASFLYWNFLSDWLRSSLIFSSMISTYKAQPLLCIVVQDV